MKLNDHYILRQVADTWVVVPLNQDTVSFNGMLTLNESGAMLWKLLQAGSCPDEMTAALLAEYDVSREQAAADVEEFLNTLIQAGCVDTQ